VFSWTPTNAQAGSSDTVQIVVLDAQGLTATQNVNIAVNAGTGSTGQAPTLPVILPQTVTLGNQLSLSIQASDADPSDTFHYGLGTGTPSGVAINPNNGELTWTPNAAQASATYPITVTVTDAGGLSDQTTFNVTVGSTTATGGGSSLGSGFGLGALELGIGAATLPVQTTPVDTTPANSSNASSTFTFSTTVSSESTVTFVSDSEPLGGAGGVPTSGSTTKSTNTGAEGQNNLQGAGDNNPLPDASPNGSGGNGANGTKAGGKKSKPASGDNSDPFGPDDGSKSGGKSSSSDVPGSKIGATTANDAAFDTAARGAVPLNVPLDAVDRTFELLNFRRTRLNSSAGASDAGKSIAGLAPAAFQKNINMLAPAIKKQTVAGNGKLKSVTRAVPSPAATVAQAATASALFLPMLVTEVEQLRDRENKRFRKPR
jgi:hypothetical protein